MAPQSSPWAGPSGAGNGWWKLVNIDQWFVFYGGARLGMFLPGILYSTALMNRFFGLKY